MTQPTRDDEKQLFARLRAAGKDDAATDTPAVEAMAADIGMCKKRMQYVLDKWNQRGWLIGSGFGFWLTSKAPDNLDHYHP